MSRKLFSVTVVVETFGIMAVSAGIGVELALHADFGFALITAGSLLIAAGGALYAKFLGRS